MADAAATTGTPAGSLSGKRVAMLVDEGFEDRELTGPLDALRAAGATVTIVGPTRGASCVGQFRRLAAHPDPVDSPLILSLSKDEAVFVLRGQA